MTWSIIARDPQSDAIGIAAASRAFAVGMLLPFIEAGVGAVATQALASRPYGSKGLTLMREGVPVADTIALITRADAGREARQVHAMDAEGRSAAFTGKECIDWSGHLAADRISVAGNMLVGPQVLDATIEAYMASRAFTFAGRLIDGLRGGQAQGGDKRGKQSASVLVFSNDVYPDLELRADDHPEPIDELARLEAVSRRRWVYFRKYLPNSADPVGVTDRSIIDAGVEADVALDPLFGKPASR